MKKITILLLTISALQVCLVMASQAQTTIDYRKLGLMRADINTNSRLYLGDSRNTAASVLGSPTSTSTYYSEIDEKNLDVWHYNRNKLYFMDNKLESFDLADATLAVGENYDQSFKVGDRMGTRHINRTGHRPLPGEDPTPPPVYVDYFYGYDITKKPGKSRNINYNIISINYLKNGNQTFEGFFEVLFNSSKKIISISLGD